MAEEEIYNDLLFLSLFLAALWVAGYLCRLIKISPIVGYIFAGILLGPQGVDFVPRFDGEEQVAELQSELQVCLNQIVTEAPTPASNQDPPRRLISDATSVISGMMGRSLEGEEGEIELENFLVILGQLGVTLLILESGLHVDFATLKVVGLPAFFVAIIGTFLPILLGMGFAEFLGFGFFPEGLALGAVMAPTSVGIALKLLHEAHVLDSQFGQTIVTAAFTDDIFSLVTLAVLLALAEGSLTAFSVIGPLLFSFLFIGIAFVLAKLVIPRIIPPFLNYISRKFGQGKRDIMHLTLMFLFLALYGFIGQQIGSHLLGAFVAGVSFAKVPRTHHVWTHEMEVINTWLLAIFFGATVAFAVPVNQLFSLDAFWKGLVVGIGPGIIGKVVSGLAIRKRWVVGWAMVGRGEFAFLVANTLKDTVFQDGDLNPPFLSEEAFGVAIWALLLATFIAPVAFGFVLASNLKKEKALEEKIRVEEGRLSKKSSFLQNRQSSVIRMGSVIFGNQLRQSPKSQWLLTIGTSYQRGLVRDIMAIFARNEIHVLSYVNEGDLETSLMTFTILIPDPSEESLNRGSVQRLSTAAGGRADGMKFKDKFFQFNIDTFIDRLRNKIIGVITGEPEVKLERNDAGAGSPEALKDADNVFKRATPEEDDADSANGDPPIEQDKESL